MAVSLEDRRKRARQVAALLFFVVAGLGTLAVLKMSLDPDPRPTTTTTAPVAPTTAMTATTPPPFVIISPQTAKDDTTGSDERSFSDRVTTPGVILLSQLGVVILAAFLSAAAIQRVMLGKYGFKVGTVEIPEVESDIEGLEATIADVKKNATAKIAALAKRLKELEQGSPKNERLSDGEKDPA